MSHTIIALSGKAGSGKSTLARSIRRNYGKVFKGFFHYCVIEKFAGPLYVLHDSILDQMETFTGKEREKKDGHLLQLLGTEWGRQIYGPNVWCDILTRKLKTMSESSAHFLVVVDDCRFENEFEALEKSGALMIRLECPEDIRRERAESWRNNTNHPSEVALDQYVRDGKFDTVFWTNVESTDQILEKVFRKMKDMNERKNS